MESKRLHKARRDWRVEGKGKFEVAAEPNSQPRLSEQNAFLSELCWSHLVALWLEGSLIFSASHPGGGLFACSYTS